MTTHSTRSSTRSSTRRDGSARGRWPRGRRQRRRLIVWVSLLAVSVLAACTGTQEPRPATLLIVGVEAAGVPQLLLLEDVTATAPVGDPRVRVVPGSARTLQAPAVALDLEDRNVLRPAAWVLTRAVADVGGAPQVTSHLQRFEVADVDAAAPATFAEDAGARLLLTEPGGSGLLDGLSLTSPFTCPSAVQVNRSGTFAVVLDDPPRCGSGDHAELWLLATDGSSATALQGTNDVLGLPAYLDQRPDEELVYFLVDAINAAHVFVAEVAGSGSHRITELTVPEPPADVVDVAGSGDALVVLADEDLLSVDVVEPGAAGRVATRELSHALITDPSGQVSELLVLGDTSTALHADPLDASFDTTSFRAVAGVIDPVTRFGYGVSDGALLIFDLLTGGDSGEPFRVHSEPITELTLPVGVPATLPGSSGAPVSVVSWVRAAP